MAVQVLKARGVPEDHILFLNLIASPEGVKNFADKFPKLNVVTAFIDQVGLTLIPQRQQCPSLTSRALRVWTRRSMEVQSWRCVG